MFFKMSHDEIQYLTLVKRVLSEGSYRQDRTNVGTLSLFGAQMRFNLKGQFPLLTTKRVFWRGVVEELLWFIRGSTDGKELTERGVHIWEPNGSRSQLDHLGFTDKETGYLGPIYGSQWRSFGGRDIDQLASVIETIKSRPSDRRMIVCSWNPLDLSRMVLPPCHCLFQFYVRDRGDQPAGLSCQMYQRSADLGLGVPFNIASYALLTYLIASITGTEPEEFIHVIGDAHIYLTHVDQLKEQLNNEPRPWPTLKILRPINELKDLETFTFKDLLLENYQPHAALKMDMAV